MKIKEIQAKSILRKRKKIDSWFISHYGMNLYRGCIHNCIYCDGRAETYQVTGEFGEEVAVKVNAIEILNRELDPKRKRKPFKPSFMMVGGGVGDSYQPVEKRYALTRQALKLINKYNFPTHILTKSTLVERDLDILKQINVCNRAVVSFSFSSVDDEISRFVEPGVPPPSERLQTLKRFKAAGIACGMFLMPVIPFITDGPQLIEKAVKTAKALGLDFIIFSGMTLKDGRQKDYFHRQLGRHYPELLAQYEFLYSGNQWGAARKDYYDSINQCFHGFAKRYHMPIRIPPVLYKDFLSEDDLVIVILEQLDYLAKLSARRSPYGYAAYSISQQATPLRDLRDKLQNLKGVGRVTERIILEILDTGESAYYKKLMFGNH